MNVKAMLGGLAWDVGLPVAAFYVLSSLVVTLLGLLFWNARYVTRARARAASA